MTIKLLILGIMAGALSGLVGVGGGIVIVPALVLFFGFTQQMAQGTTLAMLLPPVGLFAVLSYAKKGFINWPVASLLCVGFVMGSFFGAEIATQLPTVFLKKFFAIFLLIVSLKMLF